MTTELKLGPIGQIARSVSDTVASEKWYRDVLGLTHLYTFGPLAFFEDPDARPMALMSQAKRSEPTPN